MGVVRIDEDAIGSCDDIDVKVAHAQFLLDAGRPDEASKVVGGIDPANVEGPTLSLLKARTLAKQGSTEDALKLASSSHLDGPRHSNRTISRGASGIKGRFQGRGRSL